MKKLRGAVVGVGYLGNFHAQKYQTLAKTLNFDFIGVCDSNREQAAKVASNLMVASFSKPTELIGKVDFVTLATSTPSHFELTKFFLSNNIHVNVEKPITLLVEEAKALVELAKKNNLVLTVGHSERFSSTFVQLQLLISALPQKISYFELQRHAPFKERGSEVSVVHDLMIHDLDLLLAMDSSEAKVTSALGSRVITKNLDWVSANFQFKSGRQAIISVSRVAKQMTRSIKVIGESRLTFADFQTGVIEIGKLNSKNEFIFESLQVDKSDNLLLENENFIHAIMGKEKSKVSGIDGLRALKLADEVIALIECLS